jgi:hypothetical protein
MSGVGFLATDRNLRQTWPLIKALCDYAGLTPLGDQRRETEEAWAEQLLADEIKRRRWTSAEVEQRRKGDTDKVEIARRLRQETTMPLRWIAQRLNMGAAGSLANLLRDE